MKIKTIICEHSMLLLLLLSRFNRDLLCATPETAAHQAPPSLGFSRQETGVGCHFLLQCMKVKSRSEVAQSCPTPDDPMDCSLPGSSIHGICQARVLEWVSLDIAYQVAIYIFFSRNVMKHNKKITSKVFCIESQLLSKSFT